MLQFKLSGSTVRYEGIDGRDFGFLFNVGLVQGIQVRYGINTESLKSSYVALVCSL
jgi:hypothetical protein